MFLVACEFPVNSEVHSWSLFIQLLLSQTGAEILYLMYVFNYPSIGRWMSVLAYVCIIYINLYLTKIDINDLCAPTSQIDYYKTETWEVMK